MACGPTSASTVVCLETVINPFTGTLISQSVSCGPCASTTPFIDANNNLHIFANLRVNYEVTVGDHLEFSTNNVSISIA